MIYLPLRAIKVNHEVKPKILTLSEIRAERLTMMDLVSKSVSDMHRDIRERATKAREGEVQRHIVFTRTRKCSFKVCDLFLRSSPEYNSKWKLSLRYRGPYRVVEVISDFALEVEYLRRSKCSVFQRTRLKFFQNRDVKVKVELQEKMAFQKDESFVVGYIMAIHLKNGNVEVKVKWKRFDNEEPSCKSMETMKKDIPSLTNAFFNLMIRDGNPEQNRVSKTC